MQRVHFHRMRTEIDTSFSLWIHSLSGWRPVTCPRYTAGGPPSSCIMTWLPVGVCHTTSRQITAPSLQAASYGSVKGIVHHHITVGNSKADWQVEQMIRMLKDCIQCGLTKVLATFWMNHLALALLLLCMTASKMSSVVLFLLAMGCQPLLPSMAISGLPSLPKQLTPDEEEAYLAKISHIVA